MRTIRGAPSLPTLRVGFAHTLIPIALAYLVAHYFSLFVFQEQAQFTYLLSDPLGTAHTDLFGTASGGIDFRLLSANAIWYVQVGALVVGHVLGLTLAHDRALVYWPNYRDASRSQYWMLAVMVAFTCFGLYLLSVSATDDPAPGPHRPLPLGLLPAAGPDRDRRHRQDHRAEAKQETPLREKLPGEDDSDDD